VREPSDVQEIVCAFRPMSPRPAVDTMENGLSRAIVEQGRERMFTIMTLANLDNKAGRECSTCIVELGQVLTRFYCCWLTRLDMYRCADCEPAAR
jgi:hypothetical protein